MTVVLIADAFEPQKNSAAVQLTHLVNCTTALKTRLILLVPDHTIAKSYYLIDNGPHTIIKVKVPNKHQKSYTVRCFIEMLIPILFIRVILKSKVDFSKTKAVVWYSPMIFWGPLIHYFKFRYSCTSYLILRDIFPEWAADLGIIKNKIVFHIFKVIAKYQYWLADHIGIQSESNKKYFSEKYLDKKVKVLNNWLAVPEEKNISQINFADTNLKGRKVFIYAGNMGVAQGLDVLFNVCIRMKQNRNIGFAFIGFGAEHLAMRKLIEAENLDNVYVGEAVQPDDLPAIMRQCHAGIVTLDRRHKSNNIPGKFLTYIANGLPILAHINPNNDLEKLIQSSDVGVVVTSDNLETLMRAIENLACKLDNDPDVVHRCRILTETIFSPDNAWKQICKACGIMGIEYDDNR